jgi:hypothetical protein
MKKAINYTKTGETDLHLPILPVAMGFFIVGTEQMVAAFKVLKALQFKIEKTQNLILAFIVDSTKLCLWFKTSI